MIADLAIAWGEEGGDLVLRDGDLAGDETLVGPMLESLFSDARGLPDPTRDARDQDLRGWWADTEAFRWGSRLWQLDRATNVEETLRLAEDAVRDALAWIIVEGIVSAIGVSASWLDRTQGVLLVEVTLHRGTARRWPQVWSATKDVRYTAGDVALQITTR